MAGVIYNPSGSTVYVHSSTGSAIAAQPTLSSRFKALGTNQTLISNVGHGIDNRGLYGSRVYSTVNTGIFSVLLGTEVTGATVAASSGKALFTKANHGLSVGDSVYVVDTNGILTGIHLVITQDTNTFKTQFPYTSGAGTLTYKPMSGTFANSPARYVKLRGIDYSIASDYSIRQSPRKVKTAFRHDGAALAIRNGYWNEYSGSWSTAPTATNTSIGDVAGSTVTNGEADHAANVNRSTVGELVYKTSAPAPIMDDYNLPTT